MMTEHFDCLFEVTKIVLLLLYGNAQVESVFSINNDILVENLYESSIFVQRQVYDGIVHAGGVRNIEITKSMVKNVNMTHSHYKDYLKTNKKKRSKEEEEKSQKRLAAQKLKDLKAKKARLSLNHEQDVREIDSELKILFRKF